MVDQGRKNALATGLGFVAIILWSTTVPAARSVLEKLGSLFGTSIVFSLSGLLLLLLTSIRARGFGWTSRLSKNHLIVCGPLFIGYLSLFYLALGIARSRPETIVAGLVNYLWPTMILLFSIPLLGKRPHPLVFGLGVTIGLIGIVLAMSMQAEGLASLLGALSKGGVPILLAFVGSILWGLYSNLAKRYPQPVPTGAVGLFLLVAGVALFAASFGEWQKAIWSLRASSELAYMIVFPASTAYCLWEIAMRDGNIALLASASNFIPVLTTLLATAYLCTPLRWELLAGAGGVVLGAFLCQIAFRSGRRSLSRRRSF